MTAEETIAAAVAAVERGGVVGLPTDTVYGVGADPRREEATGRLFALKRRPDSVALPVLVAEPEEAGSLGLLPALAVRLMAAYWPGALTLVVPRRPRVQLHLGGDEATVGIRCPARSLTRALLRRTGPLAVTSANLHGDEPATTAEALRAALGADVDVIVDDGPCDGSPSSVVLLVGDEPRVVREGAIRADELASFWGS